MSKTNIAKANVIEMEVIVVKVLPNAKFQVKLPDQNIINAYISGKIRMNNIRILPGDKVKIELSDINNARITYRFK